MIRLTGSTQVLKPAMSPVPAAGTTTQAIAPHSALAGPVSQAIISSPPAAASSRDIPPSSFVGGESSNRRLSASSSPKMLFSDLYKSTRSPFRLRQPPNAPAISGADFDADLLSKDRAKNKEAVKKYLADKIRNDWDFKWPPANKRVNPNDSELNGANLASEDGQKPGVEESHTTPSHDHEDLAVEQLDNDHVNDDDYDDTASTYSTVSEDAAHFRPRLEWWSELSDDDGGIPGISSAYRFDTPDTVGPTVQATTQSKSTKIRRAIREEESWNQGLSCFNARRDAWTNARTARVKPKPSSAPASPLSPTRRMSFFRFASTSPPVSPGVPLSPSATHTSGDTTAVTSSDGDSREIPSKTDSSQYPVETLLPVAPPLLPPANPMRASIVPASYPNLYDRIIVHSLTPSCPVNLADILRSCVVGWKRDGEWPPRLADVPTPVVAVRKKKQEQRPTAPQARRPSSGRRMSLGFLGRRESATAETATGDAALEDVTSPGKVIRRSIQRVFGKGHERTGSNASNTAPGA